MIVPWPAGSTTPVLLTVIANELAIVVDDRWQGTGVAGLLMQHLFEAARARGLERMTGDVLASNQRMLRFVHALGFRHEAHPDDPTLMMVTKEL